MNIKLQFKVERRLGSPLLRIQIDDNPPAYQGECLDTYDIDIPVSAEYHELRLTHYRKHYRDHTYNDKKEIVIDKSFELISIRLDDILLSINEKSQGKFYPVYEQKYINDMKKQGITLPEYISPNLYFGHNGSWCLYFEYPVIDWLIKLRSNTFLSYLADDSKYHTYSTSTKFLKEMKEYFENVDDLNW